jgi:hypothetical protein
MQFIHPNDFARKPILHDSAIEVAHWNVLVALNRHVRDTPGLYENQEYMAAIKRSHADWAEVFEG